MSTKLNGKTVAFLATDGVERVELQVPRDAVVGAGATVKLITIDGLSVSLWDHDEEHVGDEQADALVGDVSAADFDALVLPGGVRNPDKLRADDAAVAFVKGFFAAHKPVAAICHGPWTLIEADVVRGRTVTSFPSLQTDLRNAGATWVDEEVVVDRGLVTSRNPDDLEAFSAKVVEEISEGKHAAQHA
ncbi:MAG: type 1 glutamine amidotransferase domain-containing protein [Solirubrobacteraceae bacterium]|nr:type 1 glutamine amidotransferase domain-containing protein [Patulibacter sp.]